MAETTLAQVIEAPFKFTADELVELALERMQATYPNFKPNEAAPEWRMFQGHATMVSEALTQAFEVPEALIRWIGTVVYQTPPRAAVSATCKVTFTALDTLGHEVPAGTQVSITPESTGLGLGFEILSPLTIAAGQTVGTAEFRAIEPGEEGNIPGSATIELQEPLKWVAANSPTLASQPAGGSNEESNSEYALRIVELARLVAPRPILPADFANFVRLLTEKEKIGRCLAIDLLELETEGGHTKVNGAGEGTVKAEGVERCVTVIATTPTGKPLSTAAREEAEEKLKNSREATFKTFVAGPTINTINVTVVGKTYKGFTPSAVAASVEEKLKEYLSPTTWGQPKGGNVLNAWVQKKVLRRQAIVGILESVEGFNFYTSLKLNGGEAEEIALNGIAPLAEAGTLSITLTEGTE